MGRIVKAATDKHEASLSPYVAEFVRKSTEATLYQLPAHLSSFPRRWPFPKGDLYHWIPLLNRFDHILELFVKEYGLNKGPQTQAFACRLLLKGDAEGLAPLATPSETTLFNTGFSDQGDRELVEHILSFTRLLFEQCGNRSLYSSSTHLNDLLNTTSLSLLKATLRLCLRLAQRYYTTRIRGQAGRTFLTSLYNINQDKVLKLASPFVAPSVTPVSTGTPTVKGKEKTPESPTATKSTGNVNAADLARIIQENDSTVLQEWGHVSFNYYDETGHTSSPNAQSSRDVGGPTSPTTPTPVRRTSSFAPARHAPPNRSAATEEANGAVTTPLSPEIARVNAQKAIDISYTEVSRNTTESLVASKLGGVPENSQYDLLSRIRVAHAMIASSAAREDLVAIRLLAVANLAYLLGEGDFQPKIAQPDSDYPRQLQIVQQLAQLIQPSAEEDKPISMDLQTIAFQTLEALGKQKYKANEVTAALNVNVNHGVLFYVMRKAAAQIASGTSGDDTSEDEWRDALFSLLIALPSATHTSRSVAEQMVSAGVLSILVDVLKLRTDKAERSHGKILNFLDTFVHNVRDAYQSLINASGFDAVADLVVYEVEASRDCVAKGEGMRASDKTTSMDWKIPFYQQLTLRWLFKVINRFMSNSGGTFDRMLRNLIDSSQLLGALRTVISNPMLYGSSIWSSAVQIVSNFIHHEPTSYQVIAEAGLSRAFLEVISGKSIVETSEESSNDGSSQSSEETSNGTTSHGLPEKSDRSRSAWNRVVALHHPRKSNLVPGILPSSEAMTTVPNAFEAICLNENGQKLFQKSNALDVFFEIFENPDHVKAMASDGPTPSQLGSQFDEMVRHHPQLKDKIMNAIKDMIMHVNILLFQKAERQGVGAKLWFEGEDGRLMVAGGRVSLKGPQGPLSKREGLARKEKSAGSSSQGDDVDMQDATPSHMNEGDANQAISIDEVVEEEASPTSADYISNVANFLAGFFASNQRTVEYFFATYGVENVLDFLTNPCLPYDYDSSEANEPPFDAIRTLVEVKPHLVVPSLLRRAQSAVDQLKPFTQFKQTRQRGFFISRTQPGKSSDSNISFENSGLRDNGTSLVKALVSLRQLCKALKFVIHAQPYQQRSSTQYVFNQVNLTDMYIQLVEDLGKLQRSCIWEEILLQESLSPIWEKATRVRHFRLSSKEAEQAFGMGDSESPSEPEHSINDTSATSPSQHANNGVRRPSLAKSRPWKQTATFKNVLVLRHVMSKMATMITKFFSGLGATLLPPSRRNSHHADLQQYQKQNAALVADKIAEAVLGLLRFQESMQFSYEIFAISQLTEILVEGTRERARPHPLTLLLQSFKDQGGFQELNSILEVFHRQASENLGELDVKNTTWTDARLAVVGMKLILEFYASVVDHKNLADATQTLAMSSRPNHDRDKPDFFLAAQFVVELRMEVTPSVRKIWESNLMEKANMSLATTVTELLKTVLDGEGEQGAFKRPAEVPIRTKAPRRLWKVNRREMFDILQEKGYEEDLVKEAVFRCYDNYRWAEDYCDQATKDFRAARYPIPTGEEAPVPPPPPESGADSSSTPQQGSSINTGHPSTSASAPTESGDMDVEPSGDDHHDGNALHPDRAVAEAMEEAVQQVIRNVTANVPGLGLDSDGPSSSEDFGMEVDTYIPGLNGSSTPGPSDSVSHPLEPTSKVESAENSNLPKHTTIEDLDEERALIRKNLIDRCLDVVDLHEDISFNLAELISAAITKTDDSSALRSEIALSLIGSLLSLPEEDLPSNGKKVAAYAHLFGLVIQDKLFYEAARGELAERFSMLLSFVRIPQLEQGQSATWVGPVLLIIERVLAQDEQPVKITWSPEDPANNDKSLARLEHDPVPFDEKEKLFNALVQILPQVRKDDSLALSALRVLVILTRHRPLAKMLGSKGCMQKLFLMIRQLGVTNDKVQSAFIIILRHVVEDEETIRQVMRSDIRNTFEAGHRGQPRLDTTHYTRNLYHLIIREPNIFVEVTNELTTLVKWDESQRPQLLMLKKPEAESVLKEGQRSESSDKPNANEDSTEAKEKQGDDRSKATEMKPPTVENPDGVIHYLLCELLSYKDVDDKEPTVPEPLESQGDVEMTSDETPVPQSDTSTPTPPEALVRKSDKVAFKAEEHSIYLYRCFILYCLTELLGSYYRAKVEFINFSRKADPQATTPSKPRSGVLNYLLNALIPTGTLGSHNTLMQKKKAQTSTWAMFVVVALCAKTSERWVERDRQGTGDEPGLVFVRKFVLEHALKAYRDAMASTEPLEMKYSRLKDLADTFEQMLTDKANVIKSSPTDALTDSRLQLGRIMFEKNFISAFTSSIADIDLNFPDARKAIKHILLPLKLLTQKVYDRNMTSDASSSSATQTADEDEISTASSVTDPDDLREETPDLFRNSMLGLMGSAAQDESEPSGDDEDEDEHDEGMYEGGFEEEMDYEEGPDPDEPVSDDDEEGMGGVGEIHGHMGIEVIDEGEDMDESDSEGESETSNGEDAGEDSIDDDDDDEDEDDDDDDEDDHGDGVELGMNPDDVHPIIEIGGDENDDDDWEEEDNLDFEPHDHGDEEASSGQHPSAAEVLEVLADSADSQEMISQLMNGEVDVDIEMDQDYVEDEMVPDGEEEDEDDDEGNYDEDDYDEAEEIVFEPEPGFEAQSDLTLPLELFVVRHAPRPPVPDEAEELIGFFTSTYGHVSYTQLGDDFDDPVDTWGWRGQPIPPSLLHRSHHHHHHPTHHNHHHRHGHPFAILRPQADDRVLGSMIEPALYPSTSGWTDIDLVSSSRSHQPRANQRNDDGVNPLLRSQNHPESDSPNRRSARSLGLVPPAGFDENIRGFFSRRGGGPGVVLPPGITIPGDSTSFFHSLFGNFTGPNSLSLALPHDISLSFGPIGGPSRLGTQSRDLGLFDAPPSRSREIFPHADDPQTAVAFHLSVTVSRWQDEARILFGSEYMEKAQRIINSILKLLVPPAIEEKKKRDEEAARKKAEEEADAARRKKEHEEREAQERKEREERDAREREEAEARRREVEAAQQAQQENNDRDEQTVEAATEMEGVEPTQPAEVSGQAAPVAAASDTRPRISYTFRGQELDITNLGIDVDYLEALPEELREEVLQSQVIEQRARNAESGQPPTEFDQDFLQALPPDIREEVLRQEAMERRRYERETERAQQAAAADEPAGAEEMDAANFLASLDPGFRQIVLMEQDDNTLSHLPDHIIAEARSYGGRRLEQFAEVAGRRPRFGGREVFRSGGEGERPQEKQPRRQVVQPLDKAGVATLLRLMFIPLSGQFKNSVQGILKDVCENRTNRAEVVTLLLSILQDGSYDMSAVERSFSSLSLRAKQPPTNQKTPQPPLKRTLTGQQPFPIDSSTSPLMVVQQCLGILVFLTQYNQNIPFFFLTPHEGCVSIGGARPNKKGKGKEIKGARYPVNALLGLLDRKLVTESSSVMEQLATLLTTVTNSLAFLNKKKDKKVEEKKDGETDENQSSQQADGPASASNDVTAAEGTAQSSNEAAMQDAPAPESSAQMENKENHAKESEEKGRKHRDLSPPEIPDHNFRLVVNILTARECSSKTFKDTLTLMNNLSHISEAREIFGQELIKSAQDLAHAICKDLEELTVQVGNAKNGTDVQGLALSKFSPTSSDQTKLLRVLTALDYLFDPKRADTQEKPRGNTDGLSSEQKSEILTTLYNNSTFTGLWDKLSKCLSAIRQRENMFNVAQILSPLIEAFMVVCKNTKLKDAPLSRTLSKDMSLSSPAPESQMESLFFEFTESHRKILNDLVRHNPKLMSGTFSLLVKNSKVLEFDNKRNYFNRRLHQRTPEQTVRHQPLSLQVRRDLVFLDSFRQLYFKQADEVKFGKLGIRFHGEEGVDAGGVTREWFQALSRQMFDPSYCLFQSVASDRTTFHPNHLSSINDQHLMFFKFIGRIIGKALYEGRVLDCHFSRAVYKRILGKPVSVKDMETLDLDYYKSLRWMLENDITDIITETFSVQVDEFGVQKTIDLVENGRNIAVTEENKREYVQRVTEHKMIGSVSEQLEHFLTGFHDIVPAELISIFNEQELELLISGLPDIDVDDWKNNTEYQNYTVTSPQIQWFWRAVRSFDKEERAKLLQFVTGTSKVPLNGFKELEGMNGFSKFNIHRDFGRAERLPSSHTCFNQLDLPEYESYEDLRKQLYTAFTAGSEYFGFA
ncbi:MAG: hypothetical protein M1822_008431 [Bathelium mastoideum]|nr:MAG: hypothetical protein M1822_008431 [Bathelium mastoideum]